jgi:hypothetical protein
VNATLQQQLITNKIEAAAVHCLNDFSTGIQNRGIQVRATEPEPEPEPEQAVMANNRR